VTQPLSAEAIAGDYERETGLAICRRFAELDSEAIPAALVAGHGPFCWGASATEAAHHAAMLEYVARMASHTLSINAQARPLVGVLLDRHFLRKHGGKAYYGQAILEPKPPADDSAAETEAKR
jgi:L-ribulose-5-phosphate 4-epimerase